MADPHANDPSFNICYDVPRDQIPLGMFRRVFLICLGTLLSTISITSTILFQQISKNDNNLRQRGRYLVALQGYFSTFFLFVICFYQAYKCRIPCAVLFWGAYLGLIPFVLVFTGRAWRLITRFDRNNAIYQSRFAESDLDADLDPSSTQGSPSSSNLSTLHSLSNSDLEQEKAPQSSSPNIAPVVSKAWYNRYRSASDKQMLALAIILMLLSIAIGVAFQLTTPGIAVTPTINYMCHSGSEYTYPYTVAVIFLFVLSPFMVFQLRGINDGFGIRNELRSLTIFSVPCFICFFLLPAVAPDFSRKVLDRTTFMALILVASHIRAVIIPLIRHFKAYPHQCAYTSWRRQRKIDRENAKNQAKNGSTISEEDPALPTHMPPVHVPAGDLDQLAMEELGPDCHTRKGGVANIHGTIKNLIRNQRKQGFRVGITSVQGSTIDIQKTDWDAFVRVLEDRQLFDRLSAFTVREFCAENTRFLYEVSRLERRAAQYEKLRDLSLTPSGVPSATEELVPKRIRLSKSPSTSTTHSTLPPLPAQFSNDTHHRIKKIVSASSVSSSAPMLRTRRSSLSYVDDSEPSSPMASSSISTFMRYGSSPALPDLEEGSTYLSDSKSKSEAQLEIVGLPHEITPLPMPPTLLIQFEYIYKNFISLGGRLELNLSHDTVQALHRKARRADWHSGMFDGAIDEIQELLFRDVWPKFVTSSQGLRYATVDDLDRVEVCSTRSGDVSRTSFVTFEQHHPHPQSQAQASSTRTTTSPSIHVVSPKPSISVATSSRVAASLSDGVSVGQAGYGKSRREDEFHEEPSKTGFRTWLSKKSRTGITAAALISLEGRNEESLGIIEQSRKSSADRRNDEPLEEACHLTRVSESDRGIVHLARLHISSLIITSSSLHRLSHLVSLRLQGNRLIDLPHQIFRLPSLRELDVSQNLLTQISGLVGMLAPTLEELFLQSNRLECLPQQLGLLRRLRLLDIADNRLGCIPVEVQRLVSETPTAERPSFWRTNDQPTPTPTQAASGSGDGISNVQQEIAHPAQHQVEPAHEDGGHDDDDYVQIRQGMKCWARGNRFWQVGTPWSSAPSPLSPPVKRTSSYPPDISTASNISPSHLPGSSIEARSRANSEDSSIGIGVQWRSSRQMEATTTGSGSGSHHPGSLVDHKGYSKDSYTSCAWTLSLADICAQVAGEKLFQDAHYYCTEECHAKRGGTMVRADDPTDEEEEEEDEECMVQMMPEWTIDHLGLYHVAELRRQKEGYYDTPPTVSPRGLTRLTRPTDLTLEEADMEIERCSVCQARLHFSGMRWKGIGVMDERIVPLEWVACSVQCRGRVESEGRGQGFMKPRNTRQGSQSRSRSQSQASTQSSTSGSLVGDLGMGRYTTASIGDGSGSRAGSGSASPSLGSPGTGTNSTRGTSTLAREESCMRSVANVSTVPREEDDNEYQERYRQSVLYGLIKSRDLRRRARTLSL
ncbi:hypothetical protein BG006_005553 [Podila minutissima]|uniref:RGS domain-containing protein n=1 Tax=Podila minutissima TaxID=64525 RepID=A0A9P5SJQ3_9FUNG|nr:hypothetical protein BG006_005553 [Podila minutissima]